MASPTSTPQPRARIPGLDGLRAIAVIGVVLYHADVPWAKGGFVGVDIFFVLSGYLVTSIVLESVRRSGGLSQRRFWAARLRRLAPAQLAMLVVITLAVAIGYRDELDTLRGQVVAALTGTMNWYLIATERSYFEQLGRPPIFRHLWSLAIELQFYLVFPVVLIALLRRLGDRLDRVVQILLAAVLLSALYMAFLFQPDTDPTRAYFDTFARLSAPLLGATLALVWRPAAIRRAPAARWGTEVSVAGGAALVGLLWIMHAAGDRSALMYRGGFLVTAVLATVVVAGLAHPGAPLGGRRGLGHPALVAIGLRSYGLYLWHWPVFVLLRPRIDVGWAWGTVFVVRVVVTIALTELCYRFVERPWHLRAPGASFEGIKARLFPPAGTPAGPRVLAWGTAAAVLVAAVIAFVPHRPTDEIGDSLRAGEAALARSGGTATDPDPVPTSTTTTGTTRPGVTTTTVPPKPDDGRVTLVGDSVMVGAAPDLLAEFGDKAVVDAKVSRQANVLAPVIRQLAAEGRLGSTVVVQVGINGTVTEEELRDMVAASDGRRVFVLNARVPRSWEASNNATVARVVPTLPRAEVIDWYEASNGKRDWFLDDGVHLTPEGRAAYADTIRESVEAG